MSKDAVYLGDGVYAELELGMVKLITWNGIETTNTIYLEPEVIDALQRYLKSLVAREESAGSDAPK